MAALRTYFDPQFKQTVEAALKGIRSIKSSCGVESPTGVKVTVSEKNLFFWANVWNVLLLVPSLAFAGFVFSVSIYIGWNWSNVAQNSYLVDKSNTYIPNGILCYTIFMIILVFCSGIVGYKCWSISQDAEIQAQAVEDAMKNQVAQIEPDEPKAKNPRRR